MYIEKYKTFSFFINIYILLIYLFVISIIFQYNKYIFIQFKINMLLYNLILLIHPILIYFSYTYIIYILSKILFCFRQNFLIQDVVLFKHLENLKKFKILSFSIILGGIWAYTQLGWGGFWFWDPIENISLILWLVLIIFFHLKEYNFLNLSKNFFLIFFSFFLTSFGFCVFSKKPFIYFISLFNSFIIFIRYITDNINITKIINNVKSIIYYK